MAPWEWGFVFAAAALYVMVLSAMLKGSAARYPFVFAYVALQFLSSAVQFSLVYYFGVKSREYVQAYWASDFLSTVLALLIMIHLIRATMEKHHYRDPVYSGLMLGVLMTAAVTLVLMRTYSRGFNLGKWMTEVGRDY